MDETSYPQLLENIQNIQPFLLLWGTCDNFINQSEAWLNGPFRSLDPEVRSFFQSLVLESFNESLELKS